ncbi:family 20 glycosylhydrolase [Longispora sp. K20-0274]|uniref:family 20 glycosylhydrolase n=1 Tax=Longispora sp. K20-0274 TaxID=3088255 RepID=UPI00399A052A
MKALRWAVGGILVALAIPATPAAAAAPVAAGPPQTVPALREWTAGTGSYAFGATSRITVDPAYAARLTDEAQVLAGDLLDLTGRTVPVVQGSPAAGDIHLTLGAAVPVEGYTLAVGSNITVAGSDDAGAFYGTRTVLQLLKQSSSVPAGSARDWPTKAERGLMIDQGRKFFTVDWVKKHIKELAYLKLNSFHFHVSDTFGFRLESATHPELTSADHYSKQDIADLVALGAKYHVTIVPEIDMPGHMNTTLTAHPELKLKSKTGAVSNEFIDLSMDASYTLIRDLITEYLPLFPGPYWHIGADEYVSDYSQYPQLGTYAKAHYGANATAKDTYYGFVNWANDIVRAGGKQTRMWNDGIKSGDGTVNPATNILVDFWYNYGLSPQQLLDRGHTVANQSWTPTYYVLGGAKPDTRWMYETWTPDLFQGSQTVNAPARNLGSSIHVWCDSPNAESEDQIAAGIRLPLRGLAQQTWGSPKLVATYAQFTPIADLVGHAPGWPAGPVGNLALGKPVTASSTETANFPASYAVDGDPGTRWSSGYSDASWIRVDLGTSQPIGRVVLRWEAAYGKAYKIQTSNDDATWTTVNTTTNSDGGVDDLAVAGTGRYVRMQGTTRATTWGYSLYEFEVYGATSTVYTIATGGKALDVPGSTGTAGTQLITWTTHGGTNQQWRSTPQADGTVTLTNGASGQCADVSGANVVQNPCSGAASQKWKINGSVITASNGAVLTTASTADNAKVTVAADTGSALQRWTLTAV